MGDELPSQSHLAGPVTRVGSVVRQRCSWCGALLEEWDTTRMARALEPGEDPETAELGEVPHWEPGALIRMTGTFPRVGFPVEPEVKHGHPQAPDDSCMMLDPTITEGSRA